MTIALVTVCDATGANISALPAGLAAGYVTGSEGVPWTAADWAAHPGAIRIDQTPASTVWDATADVDDYENGAVQLSELAGRAKARMASFVSGLRPGQRRPAVYCSAASVTPVVNALIAGGIASGVSLFVASWDNDQTEAAEAVREAAGPFPVIGRQFENNGSYDTSVVSQAWLDAVSVAPAPVGQPQVPPGQWNNPAKWSWKQVLINGQGLNGVNYAFAFNPSTGSWDPVTLPS
jgi:hypothetical protein